MKYSNIRKKALLIDGFIDSTKGVLMPTGKVEAIIRFLFPNCYVKYKGRYKTVFRICSENRFLVLKVGNHESIENDHHAYKALPIGIRRKYFARIYWHTRYTLLQEYGEKANAAPDELSHIRSVAERYGLTDIKADNIRKFNRSLKIVDANIRRYGRLVKLRNAIDYVRIKLS